MRKGAGSQLFYGLEPVCVRRSLGAPSGLPDCMGEGFNLSVSKGRDALPRGSGVRMPIRIA